VAAAPDASPSARAIVLAALVIVFAAGAAYCNSFAGTFAYDDHGAIVENPTIRHLWPIGPVLSPPHSGETVSGRPLLNLSLAINYAVSGLNVWSYHAANLLIHIAAALLLMGILRRTFLLPALRDRFGTAATPLALASALLWTVHPLQTESVTYIVQRAESLAGLFYLLTLYCVIRGAAGTVPIFARAKMGLSPSAGVGSKGTVPFFADQQSEQRRFEGGEKGDCPLWPASLWYAAAVLACLLGMACKEILITAPLMVLLYDRTFLTGSFAEAWRRRWPLYVCLAATWGLLACLVASTGLIARQAELGAPDPWTYARSQPGVILHYLRLSVWPDCLCMSYLWPVPETLGEFLPGAIVVGLLLAATVWGLVAGNAWGFLGAWFFLILAPTSSILSLNQLAHEHRMYLSLAAVAVLPVVGGYALWTRLLPQPAGFHRRETLVRWAAPMAVWAGVLTALACATIVRNSDYRSSIAIWQDAVRKFPNNDVAHHNLGAVLAGLGRTDEAIEHYQRALRLKPGSAKTYKNLGLALAALGKTNQAIEQYRQALRLKPDYVEAHNDLGLALANLGKTGEAVEHYQQALRLKPDFAGAEANLGLALAASGKSDEAIEHYHRAWQLKSEDAAAHCSLGKGLANLGRTAEAIEWSHQALRLKPDYFDAHSALGHLLAGMGKTDEALEHYQHAVRLRPDFAEARNNLANALAMAGRTSEAIEHFQQALRLQPDFAEAHNNLANALAAAGRTSEAVGHYDQALRLKPGFAFALSNLAWLLATREGDQGGDPARAVQLAERLRELNGQENALGLDTLAAAYAAAGRFGDAVSSAERALQLAESAGQGPLAKAIRARRELYRAGRPYREGPRPSEHPNP
jgi:tetratricopeptide (TPR) repeat protein